MFPAKDTRPPNPKSKNKVPEGSIDQLAIKGFGITYLVILHHDIGKPSLLHAISLQILLQELDRVSAPPSALLPDSAPLAQGRLVVDSFIVGVDMAFGVEVLDPATGLQAAVGFLVQRRPVLNGTGEPTEVNEVERGGLVGPFAGSIVDIEAKVGRHPCGLDGREVGADDGGLGVLVGKVTGDGYVSTGLKEGCGEQEWILHGPQSCTIS